MVKASFTSDPRREHVSNHPKGHAFDGGYAKDRTEANRFLDAIKFGLPKTDW